MPVPSHPILRANNSFAIRYIKSVPNASTLPNLALRSTGALMLGPLAIPIPSAAATAAASPAFTPSTGVRDRLGGLMGLLKLNGGGAAARNAPPFKMVGGTSSTNSRSDGVRLAERGGGGGGGVHSAGSRE
jgi:hypothetical protein